MLGLAGGAVALVSLLSPWYTLDQDAFAQAYQGVVSNLNTMATGIVDPAELARTGSAAVAPRLLFTGAGIALAVRPLMDLVSTPGSAFDGALTTMAGLTVSDSFTPAPGLYVGLAAAVLLIAAGLTTPTDEQRAAQATTVDLAPSSPPASATCVPSTAPTGM